jgi:hypothetical protein
VIGRHLIAGTHREERLTVLPDAFTVALARVAVLVQAGDPAHAMDVLERITPHLGDVEQRTLAYCRLAELYSEAGLEEKAVEHCAAASTLAHEANLQNGALQLNAAAALALAQYCAGNEVAAESLAGTVLVPLRGAVHNSRTTSTCESFIAMAVLLAEREIEHGRPQGAIGLCDEALSILRSDDKIRRLWEYRVLRWRAAARCHSLSTRQGFALAVDQSIGELQELLASALQAGQIAEAIASAAHLASLHRLMHRADRAIEALTPLLVTVTDADARSFAFAFLELAAANLKAGRLAEALPLIQRIQENPRAPALARCVSLQLEAEAALRSGSPERALRCASEAVEKMSSLNRFRFVGAASRYQALAFEALGKRTDALRSIAVSTEYLREFGNVGVLLQAEADEARLSGDRHRLIALAHALSKARSEAKRQANR